MICPKSPDLVFKLLDNISHDVNKIETIKNSDDDIQIIEEKKCDNELRHRNCEQPLATPRKSLNTNPKAKLVEQKITNNSYSSSIKVVVILVFVYCIYNSFTTFNSNSNILDTSTNDLNPAKQTEFKNKFSEYMRLIKSKYPNQSGLFWANIESTYRHSIIKSKDPAIVLIVNDKLTSNLASELSYDILNTIKTSIENQRSYNLNNLIINPSDFTDLINAKLHDQVKLHIDNKLNKIFQSDQRVALVKNIQQIPATSMLLFYTYGDDLISAKYPGVVILMTLEIDHTISNEQREIFSKSSKKTMEFVESHLFKLWSKFVGEDQLKPLFTRIGNNVIFVNNESK